MSVNPNAATVEQVAQACNLDVRRIQQLVKENVLPREGRGRYNIGRCMAAYIRYLQAALSAKGTMNDEGEITSTKHQRAQLLAVQLEREKLELAKEQGQVIAITDHEGAIAHLIVETKARLKAVAPRVAPEVTGESSRLIVQGKIDKAIDEALVELAKVTPPNIDSVVEEKPADKKTKTATARARTKNGAAQKGKAKPARAEG